MPRFFRSAILKLGNAPLPVCSSRLASHDVRIWNQSHTFNPKHTQKQTNHVEDFGPDDVEAQIEAVIREEKRKEKTVKFHKIKRQLRPKGAPVRKLTWDAIEQIRFLKLESPEEWSMERLAEGFSVTPDEISRILRSKFTPGPERKLKQDQMVLAKQQLTLADGTEVQPKKVLTSSTHITLPPGPSGALVATTSQSQEVVMADNDKITHVGKGSTVVSLRPSQLSSALKTGSVVSIVPSHHKDEAVKTSEQMAELKDEEDNFSEDKDGEVWDGVTFSELELQELSQTMTEKTPLVVKSGREYFDREGNFLYRV